MTVNRLAIVLAFISLLATAPAEAEIVFYTQKAGAPEDTGHQQFLDGLIAYQEEDFENPECYAPGAAVEAISLGDATFGLSGEWQNGPYTPVVGASSEFNIEGAVYRSALVCGDRLTVSLQTAVCPAGLGMWIFDDTGAWDAAFFVEVEEADGDVWAVTLENDVARNTYGHEIEGFVGAISDVGIVRMTITAVDPATGDAIPSLFETDHWVVSQTPATSDPEAPDLIDGLDGVDEGDGVEDGQDSDDDDDDAHHCNWRRHHWRHHGRHHAYGCRNGYHHGCRHASGHGRNCANRNQSRWRNNHDWGSSRNDSHQSNYHREGRRR